MTLCYILIGAESRLSAQPITLLNLLCKYRVEIGKRTQKKLFIYTIVKRVVGLAQMFIICDAFCVQVCE